MSTELLWTGNTVDGNSVDILSIGRSQKPQQSPIINHFWCKQLGDS